MMRQTKYLAIAAAALALTACDKNNDDFNIDETKDTPITIASAGVTELITRAITNDKLVGTATEPATMSVFVTGGSSNKYNATNMKWEHRGAEWQSTGATTVFFAGVNSMQMIYACSPYFDESTGTISVNVSEQTDWLVATVTGLSSNLVNLTMTHALSKLVLKPTFGTEVTNQTITSVVVGGMYASGTLNIANNQWSNLGDLNAYLEMKNNELLVIPIKESTTFPITITMEDGRKFITDISLVQVSNQLAPGTQYNISLQVGQDKVTLGDITAESWGDPVNGGNLETE